VEEEAVEKFGNTFSRLTDVVFQWQKEGNMQKELGINNDNIIL